MHRYLTSVQKCGKISYSREIGVFLFPCTNREQNGRSEISLLWNFLFITGGLYYGILS